MAPVTLKTYGRKTTLHRRNSIEVFNALFAENLCKRKQYQTGKRPKRKKPIKIKELPPPDENHHLIEDSISKSFGLEDTFDRLCKGSVYNDVKRPNKCDFLQSTSHTPVSYNTRNRTRALSSEESAEKGVNESVKREKTLDKSVNISLFIEKVPQYERLRDVKEITSLSNSGSQQPLISEFSYDPLFSKTFRERTGKKLHIASTPAVASNTPHYRPAAINETISPILPCTEPKSLIEKSYEEIDRWNYKPPDAFDKTSLSCRATEIKNNKLLRPKLQKKAIKKAKNKTVAKPVARILADNYKKRDKKLNMQPKVILENNLDILGILKSVKMNIKQDCEGFTQSEINSTASQIIKLRYVVETLERSINKSNTNTMNSDCVFPPQTPVRYLGLRKRNIAISLKPKIEKTEKNQDLCKSGRLKQKLINNNSEVNKKLNFKESSASYDQDDESYQPDPMDISKTQWSTISEPSQSTGAEGSREVTPDIQIKKIMKTEAKSPDIIPATPPTSAPIKTYGRARKRRDITMSIFNDHSYCSPNVKENSVNCTEKERQDCRRDDANSAISDPQMEGVGDVPAICDKVGSYDNISFNDIISISSDADKHIDGKWNYEANNFTEISDHTELNHDENNVVELKQTNSYVSVLEFHNYSKISEEDLEYSEDDEIIDLVSSEEEDTPEKENISCNFDEVIASVEEPAAVEDILPCSIDKTNPSFQQDFSIATTANRTLFAIDEDNQKLYREEDDVAAISSLSYKIPKPLLLKPGKSWRRSLLDIRKSHLRLLDVSSCIADSGCICTCAKCRSKEPQKSQLTIQSRQSSIRIVPETPLRTVRQSCNASMLGNYAAFNITTTYGPNNIQDTVYREKSIGDAAVSKSRQNSVHELTPHEVAREIVLRRCGQTEPIPFGECYPAGLLRNCFKIGEGVYGEVFLFRNASGGSSVMKVIPIEGNQLVNGEQQKKFEEILSEIVISMELSNLRNGQVNKTSSFSEVQKVRCVQGCYPDQLLTMWNLYDETRGSENDSPEMFEDDQLYIVLELANGGKDMEAFVFKNSIQAFSLFEQTACALAVAESALEFEHRDLHWGNLLISQTDPIKKITYCLNGQQVEVPACGIEISIIDFTLSRINCDGVVIYNDISKDPDLFSATGDYQFEIYKLMQERNENQWEHFEPYTNVLWLHYILDKMVSSLRYSNTTTKVHKNGITKLRKLKNRILNYSSINELVATEFAL